MLKLQYICIGKNSIVIVFSCPVFYVEYSIHFTMLQAIAIAESNDRIHLRSSLYNYAKHLEEKGDVSTAIT